MTSPGDLYMLSFAEGVSLPDAPEVSPSPAAIRLYEGERLVVKNAWVATAVENTIVSWRRALTNASWDDPVYLYAERTCDSPDPAAPWLRPVVQRRIGEIKVVELVDALRLALDYSVLLPRESLAGLIRGHLPEDKYEGP